MGRCWIESWGAEFVGGYGFDTTGSEDLAPEFYDCSMQQPLLHVSWSGGG